MRAAGFGILVADRHQLVGEAIRDVFREITGEDRVSTAYTLAAALVMAQRTGPGLILVDIWLGGHSLEDTVRQLKECSPRAEIIVTASRVDADLQRRALQAGAMGCIEKELIPTLAAGIVEQREAGR
jgi:DNA-binding NarL/FixJ family response regulator